MYEEIFQVKSNNITPSQGRILIASPLLNDYHFSRTVILMVNHEESGDMGVVLNKDFRYHVSLNDLVKDLEDIPSIPVYKGGPVGRDTMFFIHDIEEINDSLPLGNGLFMNGDFNQMLDFIRQQLLRIACLQCRYLHLELPLLQRLQATLGLFLYRLPFQLIDAFMPDNRKQVSRQISVYHRIPVLPIIHETIVHNVFRRFIRRHVRTRKTDKTIEVGCVNPIKV